MAAKTAVGKAKLGVGDTIKLKFNLTPVPKGRPRFGRGFAFTDKRTKTFERAVAVEAAKQIKELKPFDCAVSLKAFFWLPTKRRVDLDNLLKSLMDGLNGIAWMDDHQVAAIWAFKHFHKGVGFMSAEIEGIER